MDGSPDPASPLSAAPRHLRRRTFHTEIPDALLVPGAEPYARPGSAAPEVAAKRAAGAASPEEARYRHKRLVALLIVIAIIVSVAALVIALVVAG